MTNSDKSQFRKTDRYGQLSLVPEIADLDDNGDISKADKLGLRLILLALAGFSGAIGVGLIAWLTIGDLGALILSGGLLVMTALVLIGSAARLDPTKLAKSDPSLMHDLIAGLDQPTFIVSRQGIILEANRGALALRFAPGQRLLSAFQADMQGSIASSLAGLWDGSESSQRFDGLKDRENWSLNSFRVRDFLVVTAERQKDVVSGLQETIADINWLEPVLDILNAGILLSASDGRNLFVSKAIRRWLEEAGVSEHDIEGLKLDIQKSRLMIPQQAPLPVRLYPFPVTAGYGDLFGNTNDPVATIFLVGRKEDHLAWPNASSETDMGKLDPLFGMAPLTVALVDKDARVVEISEGMNSIPIESVCIPGADISLIARPSERDALKKAIASVHKAGQSHHPVDVHFSHSEDRVGQIHFASMAHKDGRHVVLFIVDRTQEKSLERQFVQAQKMQAVGQLAGGVAHDFNNLLTAILGFCDLLLSRYDTADQSFSDLMQIKQNANRAANLVRQLLAFSRQQTMRPRIIWITDVLSEISNLLRRLIGETIELRIKHGRNLSPVKIDPGQMDQVIINLAVNARDAMPDGGALDIETTIIDPANEVFERYSVMQPGQYIQISITDTGTGIPEDIKSKIFEPFFTTKEVGRGTGLGLATVYGIMKQLGGYIFVDTEVGVGSTFLLFLPAHIAEETTAPAEKLLEAKDLSGKGQILLVEDEEPVRMLAARALTSKGYSVVEAASGEAALAITREREDFKPDLLISDVVMPNMDGPTLMAELRKDIPDLPVILISGYAEDMVRKSLEDDSAYFLQKPFELKALSEQVKTVLQKG